MDEARTSSAYEERYLASAAEGMLRAGHDPEDIDLELKRISPYARAAAASGVRAFARRVAAFRLELSASGLRAVKAD